MSQQGLEARYLSRFQKLNPTSAKSIKEYDSAGNLTEHLSSARASIKAQEKNISQLFGTAQELVAGINTTQQMLGHSFVKNMPLPAQAIKESPGQQLGYIQLTMRFFQTGIVHFMEQMVDAEERINHLERMMGKLAEYDQDIEVLGDMQDLDLDKLEQVSKTSMLEAIDQKPSVTAPVSTPPASPIQIDKKKTADAKKQTSKK